MQIQPTIATHRRFRLFQLFIATLVFGAVCSANAAIETYDIDPVHTYVGFTVRHYFTKVPGCFTKVKGSILVNRDHLEKSSVEAVVETTSIDTRFKMRDDNLRDQFFATTQFPIITFKSSAWKKIGDNTYDVAGHLKIKDVTKEVVLHVKVLGFGPGKDGASISGWEATTTLDRRDFNVSADPSAVANQVNVIINVEADLRKPAEATK
jgi:polyisoprenoid-binding protein YceI